MVGAQILHRTGSVVAGDDRHVLREQIDRPRHQLGKAKRIPVRVDRREIEAVDQRAQVHDLGVDKVNDDLVVVVAAPHRYQSDLLTVEPQGHRVGKSDVWEGGSWKLVEEIAPAAQLGRHELVRDHDRVGTEDRIAADVFDVSMGVDDDLRHPPAEFCNRISEGLGVCLGLGIDQKDAVRAHRSDGVGRVRALIGAQQIEPIGETRDLDRRTLFCRRWQDQYPDHHRKDHGHIHQLHNDPQA